MKTIHTEYAEWIEKQADWNIAGTFTFPADTSVDTARRTFRHFWNKLDARIYGKASKRFGKKISRVCFIEGVESGNVHFHFIAKSPERMGNVETFKRLMLLYWEDLGNTGIYNRVDTTTNNLGWAYYISKTANTSAEALDTASTHIAG